MSTFMYWYLPTLVMAVLIELIVRKSGNWRRLVSASIWAVLVTLGSTLIVFRLLIFSLLEDQDTKFFSEIPMLFGFIVIWFAYSVWSLVRLIRGGGSQNSLKDSNDKGSDPFLQEGVRAIRSYFREMLIYE